MILSGITVVDFTISVAGPMATAMLADAGARVIKIERIGGEMSSEWDSVVHGLSSSYAWNARNKESIAIDLKDERGLEIARRLMREADVVIENFSPGTIARMGLGYDVARSLNPKVVYCHISGYGQTGPFRDEKAFDFLIQGEAGILAMNGTPEGMSKVPLSIADISAGMYANQAILLALMERERSGEGQEIDISMLHSLTSWLGYQAYFYWFKGVEPERIGARHHVLAPYGPYACRDGAMVNIAVLSQTMWRAFAEHVVLDAALADDPRFATNERRIANRAELEAIIAPAFLLQDTAHWVAVLKKIGIPAARVLSLGETLAHPQLKHAHAFQDAPSPAGPIPAIVSPVRMSRSEMRYDWVPVPGEHTRSILAGIGFDGDAADELVGSGIVAEPRL
ncbi:MAG: CoA transferase [Candidatus Velthaea sp.]